MCSALLEEEVDKDSSGLWGGESQTPPKETSVERETPPSSDTPHVQTAVVQRTEIQRAVVKHAACI